MPEDLAALKAKVETYEFELAELLKGGQKVGETWKAATKGPPSPEDPEKSVIDYGIALEGVFQFISRRIDLTEKLEAALRNYVKALEKRLRDLDKKVPKYDVGLER